MKQLFSMKKSTAAAALIGISLLLAMSVTSCKKESSTSTDSVSEEEAAEAISQSVSTESASMSQQSADAVIVANTELIFLPCGMEFDSSVSGANLPGAAITNAYNVSWSWVLSCSGIGIPQKINFDITGSSSYDAPRMSSNDNSTASFELTGLELSAPSYTMTANYQRYGTQQSKVYNKNSFTSTIVIASTDLLVSKTTQIITSGKATVAISGTSSSGKSFSYSGALTFLGNKQATLTMASGHTYNISW
ncbi:hypothetical protein BH10BAC2_BH10BAC2_23160 [soil metagenome]